MMRTYRHPEQKPVLSEVEWVEGYLKGFITRTLDFIGDDISLKRGRGPRRFPA